MKTEVPYPASNAADFSSLDDDVFGRIAARYDLLCDLFSFGLHRLWKQRAARMISKEPWTHLLDCATGTGDIILRLNRCAKFTDEQRVIAADNSPQMLEFARRRVGALLLRSIEFCVLDAHHMDEVPDDSVDVYSISLALKICERQRVLREALRVLRPGGRLVILETSNIENRFLQRAYLQYMRTCVPIIGWLATGGDTAAYTYLLRGLERFPSAEQLALEVERAGFVDADLLRLTLGIVAIHTARKPHTNLPHR